MRALVLNELKTPLVLQERPELQPEPGEVVVALKAASLNRRDYWITQGMYPGIKLPVILGSDGAGVVTASGPGVDSRWHGSEVLLYPGRDWGPSNDAQSADFTILGLPADGTFATQVLVRADQLFDKPSHLDWQQSAALPLAGVTAWRALFVQGGLQAGQTVLISGIGGGVATMALQFAVAAGARVWVTSSSSEKIDLARQLGATGGSDYRQDHWETELVETLGQPQLIIDGAGGSAYDRLIKLAAPGGRIVNYGATTGAPDRLDLFKVFWKQLRLVGSTMGSPNDFAQMLDDVRRHRLAPVIDSVRPLSEGQAALESLRSSSQFGKLVLDIC